MTQNPSGYVFPEQYLNDWFIAFQNPVSLSSDDVDLVVSEKWNCELPMKYWESAKVALKKIGRDTEIELLSLHGKLKISFENDFGFNICALRR